MDEGGAGGGGLRRRSGGWGKWVSFAFLWGGGGGRGLADEGWRGD